MRILAAEDNPVFQAMLKSLLKKWDYEVTIAHDGGEAWAHLQSADAPRLAILDWMMPVLDGVEVCRRVRAAAREPYIYILLLTARTQAEDLVEGMEAGADDYLTKPFNAHELRARLRAGRRIVELQEELLLAREALREQATHDGLTGVRNRAAILDLLEEETSRSGRERQPLAVLMVDLDHFKQINDTFGHQTGDTVLLETARRMKAMLRSYDAVGRYGGEEFLVIVPGCSPSATASQAERLRLAIGTEPFRLPGATASITCSIGFAWTDEVVPGTAGRLIHDADVALYSAKALGRNCVQSSAAYPASVC